MSFAVLNLPKPVVDLYEAHAALCQHFRKTDLTFTLDGKLVGDIGEAVVAEAFGIELCRKRTPGVDGHARDGRSVQIKATGRSRAGPAFSPGEGVADHLIFVRIDFEGGTVSVLYNGPEAPVRRMLPEIWIGTKVVPLSRILVADAEVSAENRLRLV